MSDASDHEIRVSAAVFDRAALVALPCSCGEAWNMDPGHTLGELSDFAGPAADQAPGQHTAAGPQLGRRRARHRPCRRARLTGDAGDWT